MSKVIKIDPKCPDISVRRRKGQNWQYIVRVDGEVIPAYDDGDNNWSRKIYISKKHRVVIKIDDDFYPQSRNEVVFWTEHVAGRDKRYFAPVLGWGTTSMIYTIGEKNEQGQWEDVDKHKKVFYCVQQYIWGAKEVDDSPMEVRTQVRRVENLVVNTYYMSDFSKRQGKVNNKNNFKLHDYGLFRTQDNWDLYSLKSDRIPRSAAAVRKQIRQTGKEARVGV